MPVGTGSVKVRVRCFNPLFRPLSFALALLVPFGRWISFSEEFADRVIWFVGRQTWIKIGSAPWRRVTEE